MSAVRFRPAPSSGGVAKWLNAAVCKTALSEFGGSNPPSSIIGISYKGSTSVSKTASVGSIPTIPVYLHGGIGEGVNTLVCGSSMRGFDSHIPPHNGGLPKWLKGTVLKTVRRLCRAWVQIPHPP